MIRSDSVMVSQSTTWSTSVMVRQIMNSLSSHVIVSQIMIRSVFSMVIQIIMRSGSVTVSHLLWG